MCGSEAACNEQYCFRGQAMDDGSTILLSASEVSGTGFYVSYNCDRTQDYENYLCGLLLPAAAARRGFFAIRAWNIETANIKSVVNESMMAKIRIQWWRDILTQLYKVPCTSPFGSLSHFIRTPTQSRLLL